MIILPWLKFQLLLLRQILYFSGGISKGKNTIRNSSENHPNNKPVQHIHLFVLWSFMLTHRAEVDWIRWALGFSAQKKHQDCFTVINFNLCSSPFFRVNAFCASVLSVLVHPHIRLSVTFSRNQWFEFALFCKQWLTGLDVCAYLSKRINLTDAVKMMPESDINWTICYCAKNANELGINAVI